ncbi:amino acid adenylation domain-containing protein [Streptomyces sp. BE133]|uniref:amino acid adenylation domain-containing protein n=1 Tax=Streptomyces sp. BE133 TaxID=3002523 RepID=UPI002E79844A|nr:amino acid adenylation domain-containing protein [Streptomyces sp. BE133]MEE1806584.1 amino acid adenylation domain-containing protein [Streptomyces sp. BE133]
MDQTSAHALYDRFLRGLARSPHGVAIRAGDHSLTYTELYERALTWAGSLLAGLPERPAAVGVLAAKGIDAYTGILACLFTGVTMVPLQPAFPVLRTRQMLEAAGVQALIVDGEAATALARLRAHGVELPALLDSDRSGDGQVIAPDPALRLPRPCAVAPDDVAYVLFTSGSTGRPKGVPVTQANGAHYFGLLDSRYDFGPDDVFSQNFDLNFDCAVFDVFCAWGAGATLVAVPASAYLNLPEFVAEQGITVWFSTPSVISLVRRTGGLGDGELPSLRWSFFAGEAVTIRDVEDWQRAAAKSSVENLYGPTELTITITHHRWSPEESLRIATAGVVPIGQVHPGHEWLVVDESGEPRTEEGELCIAGPQLTAGYLDPADDADRFLVRKGLRYYRTGDRVRQAEGGQLLYLGRLDQQVQVRGVRVELAEIDEALRGCPGVEDGVAVPVRSGESVELVAFHTGEAVPAVTLARELSRSLPRAVIPRHFLHTAEFPLNPNRKIDRRALIRLAEERLGGVL